MDTALFDGSPRCGVCSTQLKIKDQQYFFIESSIIPQDKRKALDKKKWTLLRKENFSFFQEEFQKLSPGFILDIGVAIGQFHELFPKNSVVIGADFIPYPNTVDVVCDLNLGVPFKQEVFDIVFASNVLEHIHEPRVLLKSVFNSLKPKGIFLGSVPFLLMEHQAPYDYFRYTRFEIEKMFSEAGFLGIKIVPLGRPIDVFVTTAHHFLKSIMGTMEKEHQRSTIIKWASFKCGSLVVSICLFLLKNLFLSWHERRSDFTLGYGIYAQKP